MLPASLIASDSVNDLSTILQHTAAEGPVPDVHVPAWRDMEKIEAEKVIPLPMRGGARKKTAELRCQCRGNSSRRADAV